MRVPQFRFVAITLLSGLALSGCASDMYGNGYGYGAYGYGYPYGGYGYDYGYPYGGYGYGYGGYYDPFGWYGDFYYPGVGIFVYDRDRHRHQWTDDQRRFWENRRTQWQNHGGTTTMGSRGNWSGFNHSSSTMTTTTGGWHHHHG
jgi:hypothetical protein